MNTGRRKSFGGGGTLTSRKGGKSDPRQAISLEEAMNVFRSLCSNPPPTPNDLFERKGVLHQIIHDLAMREFDLVEETGAKVEDSELSPDVIAEMKLIRAAFEMDDVCGLGLQPRNDLAQHKDPDRKRTEVIFRTLMKYMKFRNDEEMDFIQRWGTEYRKMTELDDEIKQAKETEENFRRDNEGYMSILQEFLEDKTRLEQTVQEKTRLLEDKKAELDLLLGKEAKINDEIARLRDETKLESSHVSQMKEESERRKEMISLPPKELQATINEMKKTLETEAKKNESIHARISALKRTSEVLQDSQDLIEVMPKRIRLLSDEWEHIVGIRNTLTDNENKQRSLTKENESLESMISSSEAELERIHEMMQDLEKQKHSLMADFARSVKEADIEIQQKREELQKLEAQNRELEDQEAILKNDLEQLSRSHQALVSTVSEKMDGLSESLIYMEQSIIDATSKGKPAI